MIALSRCRALPSRDLFGSVCMCALTSHFRLRASATGTGTSGSDSDGVGMTAQFNAPASVVATPDGSIVYVGQSTGNAIRKVVVASRVVTTLAGQPSAGSADGTGTSAQFYSVQGLALSADQTMLYASEHNGQRIRQVRVSDGRVTPFVGVYNGAVACTASACTDGVGTNARFNYPRGITLAGSDTLLVADGRSRRVRQIQISSRTVTTVAGSGTAAGTADGGAWVATFHNYPYGISASLAGHIVVISDYGSHRIRIFRPTNNLPFPPSLPPAPAWPPSPPPLPPFPPPQPPSAVVSTLAGSTYGHVDGTGSSARFSSPHDVVLSPDGEFALVADNHYDVIRHIGIDTQIVTTLAGKSNVVGITDGVGTNARFNAPTSICLADFGKVAFVTDSGTGRLRLIQVGTATVTTIAGSTSTTSADGVGTNVKFYNPYGVTATPDGSIVFVAEFSGRKVRKVVVATRTVTTLAGSGAVGSADGVGANAQFYGPWGIDVTSDGGTVYVAESTADRIRKIDVASRTVTTLAGMYNAAAFADGVGTNARFNAPSQVALAGSVLWVADSTNRRIRQVDVSTRAVTTSAGTGIASSVNGGSDIATFHTPVGIAATPNGMQVLVTDTSHYLVRQFLPQALYPFPPSSPPLPTPPPSPPPLPPFPPPAPPSSMVTTLAGSTYGYVDGTGTSARFYAPYGVSVSPSGTFALVADSTYKMIRHIDMDTQVVTTLAGKSNTGGSTDGVGSNARFGQPTDVALADHGRVAFVVDQSYGTLRRIDVGSRAVTTIAGGGSHDSSLEMPCSA